MSPGPAPGPDLLLDFAAPLPGALAPAHVSHGPGRQGTPMAGGGWGVFRPKSRRSPRTPSEGGGHEGGTHPTRQSHHSPAQADLSEAQKPKEPQPAAASLASCAASCSRSNGSSSSQGAGVRTCAHIGLNRAFSISATMVTMPS